MKKIVFLWVDDLNQKHIPWTRAVRNEKAMTIFEDLSKTEEGEEIFLGSKGMVSDI